MTKSAKTNLLILLCGVIALFAGCFFTVTGNNQAKRDTAAATATVIDYHEEEQVDNTDNMGTTTYYYPVMSYEADGKTVQSQYSQGELSETYEIGESVAIKYNPDDPEEFMIDGDKSIQFGTIWEIPLGIVLIIVALLRMFGPLLFVRGKH